MIQLANAVKADPYTPLRPGLWQLDGWPGMLLAVPLATDSSTLLCMDLTSGGNVESSCVWRMGNTEMLAEPMRAMRCEEPQDDVTYYGA